MTMRILPQLPTEVPLPALLHCLPQVRASLRAGPDVSINMEKCLRDDPELLS